MWTPLEAIAETMHRRVCPLYAFDDARRVHVVGSAVPFDSGGFRFLITATHVLFRSKNQPPTRVFTMGRDEPCVLSGARIAWDHKPGVTPDLDLTLIALPDKEADALAQQYQFSTPDGTATVDVKKPGVHYIIAGYPAARNKMRSTRSYPSAMATHLITGEVQPVAQYTLPGKSDGSHFVLALPYEQVPRLSGGDFRVPKAFGMSGGGVWKTVIDIPRRLATTPELVGIGIEHHKDRGLFVATKVQQAIPLLEDLIIFSRTARGPGPDTAPPGVPHGTAIAILLRSGGHAMSNQNNRGGDDAASSNTPAEPDRKHKGGGNMGAGKSGGKSFGAEKPEVRDDNGSKEAGRDWD